MPEPKMPTPEEPSEQSGERMFAFSPEEREGYYRTYLAESLKRDYSGERLREDRMFREALIVCLGFLSGSTEKAISLDVIEEESRHFADCLLASKVNTGKMGAYMVEWMNEQKTCHQNVEILIKKANREARLVTDIPYEYRVTFDELAQKDHLFFNSFALYLAYVSVIGDEPVQV